jgi:hypothetical protein
VDRSTGRERPRGVLAAIVIGLAVALAPALPAAAAAVAIHDDSHVLDVTRVQNAAASLPDPVAVYTTTKFADDKAAFDREAQAKVSGPTVIVIAINTQSRHLAIRTGPRSRVRQGGADAATQAFVTAFRANSDYTAATIAAIDSLRDSIAQAGGTTQTGRTAHRTGIPAYLSGCFCLLLVGLVIALVVFLVRRSGGRGRTPRGFGRRSRYGAPGGYDPGYGGYQSSGVNPWVAGGAGAAAGGLLGYELGRMEGEREAHQRDEYGGDGGGFGGGGADADFGGGGGDFGGGDFGGGGDSGGGDSGGSGDF